MLYLDKFNRFMCQQLQDADFLLCAYRGGRRRVLLTASERLVSRVVVLGWVNICLPLESERLASVWTTKKWGRSPGWNLLRISSMMSLMCLLPTATRILLAACCQSGITSWVGRKHVESKMWEDILFIIRHHKKRIITVWNFTFERVISSEAKEMTLFILG